MTKHDPNGLPTQIISPPTRIQGALMCRVVKSFAVLIALGCLAMSMATAQAVPVAQMLDDYDVAQIVQTPGGIGTFAGSTVVSGSIAGGSRSVYVEKTSGSANPALKVEALDDTFGGSTFNVSRSAGVGGVALLQWDGQTIFPIPPGPQAYNPTSNLGTNIMTVDMTLGGAAGIVIRVLTTDIAGQTLILDLFGNSAADRMTQSVVVPAVGSATDILFPWAGFTTTGSPSLSAIHAFTLSVEGPIGSDISMDYIATYVPEPATASMLGLGMVALIGRLRKRSYKQLVIDSQF
jgi:hypothetical protein